MITNFSNKKHLFVNRKHFIDDVKLLKVKETQT